LLADVFPASLHVRALVGVGTTDARVWELAAEHDCLLVTKDEDFHRLSVLRGAPSKAVWLRLGNSTTEIMADLLRRHDQDLRAFADQSEATFLAIG
jgi:predicted nuclease of predicted toxin-antitoxin system